MRIEIDTEAGILEIDGIKISLDLLRNLAEPNPHRLYHIVRRGDVVSIDKFLMD